MAMPIVYQHSKDYLRAVVRTLARDGVPLPRALTAEIESRIPIMAGTSSSTALSMAWTAALLKAAGNPKAEDPSVVMRLSHRAEVIEFREWTPVNIWVNVFIALLNCTLLIWLYASLRPMYGVGTRTALITSAFGLILGFSLFSNLINLGLLPLRLGMIEAIFEAVEFLIAMLVGASIYEGRERRSERDTRP